MTTMTIDYNQLPDRRILCLDMKSFYASIEAVERGLDPLRTCLAVIGDKTRSGSVVLAASPAIKKKYGIRSGSRHYEIPRRGDVRVVEARMQLYLETSIRVTEILNRFAPLEAIHVYSIDEAWIMLGGTELLFGPPRETARMIREEILEELGLHCSMGLAPNMFLAKVAMDTEGKERGFAEWRYADVPSRLWPLELGNCWGIGSRIASRLRRVGAKTVGDLAHLPLEWLEGEFGIMGNQLYHHAWGVDLSQPGEIAPGRTRSLGKGITLLRDYKTKEAIRTVILEMCEEVARRARRSNLAGRTVALGLGYSRDEPLPGFRRQTTLEHPTSLTADMYDACLGLFRKHYGGQVVRQINITLSNLAAGNPLQLELFRDRDREFRLARAMDTIRDRFGASALMRCRSLKAEAVTRKQAHTIGGHRA